MNVGIENQDEEKPGGAANRQRRLEEVQPATALRIAFVTTIVFPSQSEDWDAGDMVYAGFKTQGQQREYINQLRVNSDYMNFDSVEEIEIYNDAGQLVTDPADTDNKERTSSVPVKEIEIYDDAGLVTDPVDTDNTERTSSVPMSFIIGGTAAAAGLLFIAAGAELFRRKRRRRWMNRTAPTRSPTEGRGAATKAMTASEGELSPNGPQTVGHFGVIATDEVDE